VPVTCAWSRARGTFRSYSGSTPTTTTTTKWAQYPRRQLGPDHLTKPTARSRRHARWPAAPNRCQQRATTQRAASRHSRRHSMDRRGDRLARWRRADVAEPSRRRHLSKMARVGRPDGRTKRTRAPTQWRTPTTSSPVPGTSIGITPQPDLPIAERRRFHRSRTNPVQVCDRERS
jgi:hypothetical protein